MPAFAGKADIVRSELCEAGGWMGPAIRVYSLRTTSTMYRTHITPGMAMAIAIKAHSIRTLDLMKR